jgi:hypothetical protein
MDATFLPAQLFYILALLHKQIVLLLPQQKQPVEQTEAEYATTTR